MSKINPEAKSKLSGIELPVENPKKEINIPEKIIVGEKRLTKVHSFALKSGDQERLQLLVREVQSQTNKKITSTDVIRGLLISGEKMELSLLIDSIQKTFLE